MVVTFVYGSLDYVCDTLDLRRLNKQATEALQLIHALERMAAASTPEEIKKIGYANHPITRMWEGYLPALQYYYNATLAAYRRRLEAKHAADPKYKNKRTSSDTDPSTPSTPSKRVFYPFTEQQLASIQYETLDAFLARDTSPIPASEPANPSSASTPPPPIPPPIIFPWWFQWHPVIASHWASLLRKDPAYYQPFYDALPEATRTEIAPFLASGYVWTNKLTQDQIRDFQVAYCAPIGAGAPANYRWTREEVMQWMADPLRNPKTGRAIKEGKTGIYGDLLKAKKIYSL